MSLTYEFLFLLPQAKEIISSLLGIIEPRSIFCSLVYSVSGVGSGTHAEQRFFSSDPKPRIRINHTNNIYSCTKQSDFLAAVFHQDQKY